MSNKDCTGCIYDGEEDTFEMYCDECSRRDDVSCSCHCGNPPCSVCENDFFDDEPRDY